MKKSWKTIGAAAAVMLALAVKGQSNALEPIRPDPKLTPGAWLTKVTVEELAQKGYANGSKAQSPRSQDQSPKGVRNVPEAEKRAVFMEYFHQMPATLLTSMTRAWIS